MLVGGRLILYFIVIWCSFLLLNIKGEILNAKERQNRHNIFPLLSYLRGYKSGQNLALQLPPFVLSPVIIVPLNQQQSINIQKSGTDESFQENGGTLQTYFPVQVILNSTLEDIETNIGFLKENCTLQGKITSINDTFRQINIDTSNSTESVPEKDELVSTTNIMETVETENFTTTKISTTDEMNGFYPVPIYDNNNISHLELTTPLAETALDTTGTIAKESNVTSETNKTEIETSEKENIGNNLLESGSSRVLSQITTEKYYARPNTRYYNPHSFWHNAMVDQSSITTNSYREEEKELPLPPRYDDRWLRFSSLSKVVLPASGFKPLAGLYYDGFLHKSLTKKTGFIPFYKYYYD